VSVAAAVAALAIVISGLNSVENSVIPGGRAKPTVKGCPTACLERGVIFDPAEQMHFVRVGVDCVSNKGCVERSILNFEVFVKDGRRTERPNEPERSDIGYVNWLTRPHPNSPRRHTDVFGWCLPGVLISERDATGRVSGHLIGMPCRADPGSFWGKLKLGSMYEDVGSQFTLGRIPRVAENFVALGHGIFGRFGAALRSSNSGPRLTDRDYQGDDLADGSQDGKDGNPEGPLRELGRLLGSDGLAAIGIGGVGVAAMLTGGLGAACGWAEGRHWWRWWLPLALIGLGLFFWALWPGLSLLGAA